MKAKKKNLETKLYGRHACLSLFKHRPDDLIRVYITEAGVFEFRPLIKHCVENKLAYHIVSADELENITKSTHHEGIGIVAKRRQQPELKDILKEEGLIIALEGVENPHNLGAIMRSAAHFGVKAIVYEAKVPVALSAAAQRTAEGGAEGPYTYHLDNWHDFLDQANRSGFKIYATSSHKGDSLYKVKFGPKSILFFGAEGEGLSQKMSQKIKEFLQIPGTGMVESLNVSNATAVILSEWYRQINS
ncbi:MAG TPA: TrmH family RNA methyltransferase [Bacteriovoracaceae bacterium]|nr:TrmH family RNA methyltransferase [Bacteriovoracaceae bacterium]